MARVPGGVWSTTSMKSNCISPQRFRNRLALLMLLSEASCLARARAPEQDAAALLEQMQREAATAELQVTLAGNLKDFSIATEEAHSQASRLAQNGQVGAAAAAYRESLKIDPDNAELHFDWTTIWQRRAISSESGTC